MMMFRNIILIFIFAHVLSDFYFQPVKLADAKDKKYVFLIVHSFIYGVVTIGCALPFSSINILIGALILSLIHFTMDTIKYVIISKKLLLKDHSSLYLVDQLVHVASIIEISYIIAFNEDYIVVLPIIRKMLEVVSNDATVIFKWLIALLLIGKPANITIKKLILKYEPSDWVVMQSNSAGAFIGTLERIIVLLCLYSNQYSAIGFVLTAKSIARYNKMTEDKEFSEYYLLGTLLSMLYVICTYFIVF